MTDLPYLASRLFGTPLLIARPKLEVILEVVARKLTDGHLPTPSPDAVRVRNALPQIVDGVAVLPILGTLVRRSSYLSAASGLTSYHEIEVMAEEAFADSAVRAVLLEIDSSGGEAGGVFDLALRLRELSRRSGKPLWAIADEAALSAAYAIASSAERVWLTRTAEVGSIGVVAVHVDESVADAKAGLAYTFLYAGAHKIDGHPHAPLPASVAETIQADVDRLYAQFVALVAEMRSIPAAAVRATEARVYRGDAALAVGLADAIGTRAEAIAALQQRASGSRNARSMSLRVPATLPPSRGDSTHSLAKEVSMNEPTQVEDRAVGAAEESADQPQRTMPEVNEAAVVAKVEAQLRAQLAELTEIAAQAKRLGVVVDPAQALAQGLSPDALRKSVLEQAAARDVAQEIVVHAPAATQKSITESPLVKAAKAYGERQ